MDLAVRKSSGKRGSMPAIFDSVSKIRAPKPLNTDIWPVLVIGGTLALLLVIGLILMARLERSRHLDVRTATAKNESI
jgi:hypothetical protein